MFTCKWSQQLAEDEKLNSEDVSHPKTEDTSKKLLFNPNVFTEFKLAGDPEVVHLISNHYLNYYIIFWKFFAKFANCYLPGNCC